MGLAFNATEGEELVAAQDWLASFLTPKEVQVVVDKEDGEVVREKKEVVDLNRVGERMEPSTGVGGGMGAAIEEKRRYVAMLERLLQARLEQSKEESLDSM